MKNQWRWVFLSVITVWCCFLSGCVLWEFDEAMASSPPEEKIWIKKGWNSGQVQNELAACYEQRKLLSYPFTIESDNELDLCMLHKGFTFVLKPDLGRWNNVCREKEQRVRCRVYRGEMVVPPDETALQIKPDPFVKPKPEVGYIECRRDMPKYEGAYCECSIPKPWSKVDPCIHLLKYKYPWIEESGPAAVPEKSEAMPLQPQEDRLKQLLRENLKELQNAQDKTQVKPYAPPSRMPAAPQVPNPRLDKLKGS